MRVLLFIRKLRAAFQHVRGDGKTARPRARAARPNPWPRCQGCYRRVPARCGFVDEHGTLCDLGKQCGCCPGHRPLGDRSRDDGAEVAS